MKTSFLLVMIGALLALPAHAVTLIVPDQYPSIQGAIVAASAGDSILVRPGTYVENINYRLKPVSVISEEGPAATIIDGSEPSDPDSGSVATVNADGALLQGFTLRGGTGTSGIPPGGSSTSAGGVALLANAIVRGNWITDNHVRGETVFGGAVFAVSGSGFLISSNRIYSNTSEWIGPLPSGRGGAITIGSGTGVIEDNEVFDNEANHVGGIYELGVTFTEIRNNVIACNRNGGIAALFVTGNTVVENTLFGVWSMDNSRQRNNTISHNLGYGAACVPGPGSSCNNFFGNTTEDTDCFGPGTLNISVDPLYGETGCGASYCLQSDSPLLPEHTPPGCGLIGARGSCATIGIDVSTSPAYASGPLQARPNPLTTATTLTFRLSEPRAVVLEIHDALGRTVVRLMDGDLPAGVHELVWDGRDANGNAAASGAYVVELRSTAARWCQKLLLIK